MVFRPLLPRSTRSLRKLSSPASRSNYEHKSFLSFAESRHRYQQWRGLNTSGRSLATESLAKTQSSEEPLSLRWGPSPSAVKGDFPENVSSVQLEDGSNVAIEWKEDPVAQHSFLALYLRDCCSCHECQHPETKQRQINTFAIDQDVRPDEIVALPQGLSITWAKDGHKSFYDWTWLLNHARPSPTKDLDDQLQSVTFWDSSIARNPPSIPYEDVMRADDSGVKTWTALIKKYGFCYVDGCPVTPEATQELLERIAFVQHTHYGGFWDFTSDLTKKDTAYTTLGLGAHTDTTYFRQPAGLQMFHLLSHTEGEGGSSLLVDGYRAADLLRSTSLNGFSSLSGTGVRWHASGNVDVSVQSRGNVLEDIPRNGDPIPIFKSFGKVRWNNDDRAAFLGYNAGHLKRWYKAARSWDNILRSPDSEYWEQLRPGRPLIFDNWRVLHGRSAFTGKRRMCGGYITADDFVSRWRMTNYGRETVLKHI